MKIMIVCLTFATLIVAQDTENYPPPSRDNALLVADSYFQLLKRLTERIYRATKRPRLSQFTSDVREVNDEFRDINDSFLGLLEPAAKSCFEGFTKEERERYFGKSLRELFATLKKTAQAIRAHGRKFAKQIPNSQDYAEVMQANIQEIHRSRTVTDPIIESCQ